MPTVIPIQPEEDVMIDFDCTPSLRRDEVIQAVIGADADGLTFPDSPAISGKIFQRRVSGAVKGKTYHVTTKIQTNYSPILTVDHYFRGKDY